MFFGALVYSVLQALAVEALVVAYLDVVGAVPRGPTEHASVERWACQYSSRLLVSMVAAMSEEDSECKYNLELSLHS